MRLFTGVDVDARAIAWDRAHLPFARFDIVPADPPTTLSDGAFDVIIAISVFSRLEEARQFAWLAELSRLLAPRGLLIATTHSEQLFSSLPDLTPGSREELALRGFLFVPGGAVFNDNSAFHSLAYLKESWGQFFRLRLFREHGLCGFQDLSVWEKP